MTTSQVEIKNEEQEEIPLRKKIKLPDFIPFTPQIMTDHSKRKQNTIQSSQLHNLPIYSVTTQIIDLVQSNQIVIITGGTGCGKSTQVPQIIMKHHQNVEYDQPQRVKIICTQPRRIAAKSLAKRVAQELDCPLGSLVGYQVGMDAIMGRETQILFVTTGIFLQKLVHERERLFQEYTHIIMDEVHERDIDIDFSLIILKHFLKQFTEMKVILMSATICSTKFANYFSNQSIARVDDPEYIRQVQEKFMVASIKEEDNWGSTKEEDDFQQFEEWGNAWREMARNQQLSDEQKKIEVEFKQLREEGKHFLTEIDTPAPVISVPQSQKFVIDTYYLDNIHEFFNSIDTAKQEDHLPVIYQESLFLQDTPKIQVDSEQALLKILEFIESTRIKNSLKCKDQKPNGAVLIFLPGYQEIMACKEAIFSKFGEEKFQTIVLHSTIAISKDFEILSKDKRRVILSTNVAESSITVPDCLFVIDFCMTKEIIYNPKNLCEKLSLQYCSKASCDQRKGRTGRLFPGVCFRLIPERVFKNKLSQYSLCEMLRCPLEKIVLRLKKIHQIEVIQLEEVKKQEQNLIRVRNVFQDPKKTLSTALEPPSLTQIDHAIRNLQRLGALTYEIVNITQLGQLMCELPIDIFLTRFLLYSNIIGCGINGINVAAIMSQRKSLFLHQFQRNQKLFLNTLYLYDGGCDDDILIQLRIYVEWEGQFFGETRLNQKQNELKKILKSFSNSPITNKERLFCEVKQLDPKNLREILTLKYELMMRLDQKYLFLENQDLYNQENVLKLKSAFGAAFKNNLLEVKRNSINLIDKKIKFIHDLGLNHQRTLAIEGDSIRFDEIHQINQEKIKEKIAMLMEQYCEFNGLVNTQQRLIGQNKDLECFEQKMIQDRRQFYLKFDQDFLNNIRVKSKHQKCWINTVQLKTGMILIEINNEKPLNELAFIFKRILHESTLSQYKRQSSNNNNNNNNNTKIYNWKLFVDSQCSDILNLITETNSNIFYANQSVVMHSYKEINCENDSINFINIRYGKDSVVDRLLVAYEVQEKELNRRNSARQIMCVMQDRPMWMQLLALVFGVQVRLFYNKQKSHFLKARIDDRDFQFDHFLTEEDLFSINDLRFQIKRRIESPDQPSENNVWKQLKQLERIRQRILFSDTEKWRGLFDVEMKDQIASFSVNWQENCMKRKRIAQVMMEVKNQKEDFMEPIQVIKSDFEDEIPKQFDEEGIRIYTQIQQLYSTWKKSIIQQIRKQNFFLNMGSVTQLCCAQCEEYISFGRVNGLRNLEEDKHMRQVMQGDEGDWVKRVIMLLEVNSFGDFFGLATRKEQIQSFMCDDLTQTIFQKIQLPLEPSKYVFLTCHSGNHIIGFYPRLNYQKALLTLQDIDKTYIIDRKLKLVYTSMKEEAFVFRRQTIRDIIQNEKLEIQKRKSQVYDFACKCCFNDESLQDESYFKGNETNYSKHIKLESHKRAFEQMQYTII